MIKSAKIPIKLLNKEYTINCPEGSESELIMAAQLLEREMQAIKRAGRIVGVERIAVVVALNFAHKLLHQSEDSAQNLEEFASQVKRIQSKIDDALEGFGLTEEPIAMECDEAT